MHSTLAALFAPLLAVGCATVNPGEGGIFFRPYSREARPRLLAPGVYAKAPWNEVVTYDLRWRTSTEKADVQTRDKLHMVVPTAIVYRPKASHLVEIHQSLGPRFYDSTVKPALLTALRSEFAHRTHDEVVPKAADLQADILKELQRDLAKYNLEVDSVTFTDLDYPPELARTMLEQMTTQQQIKNKDAQLTIVRREQEIASARARGEAESRLATKEAEAAIAAKDAEIAITRSKAEAESVRLRSAALSAGYLKLRAIEALEAAARGPNAKLYFVPVGKNGLPLSLHLDGSSSGDRADAF